MRKLLLILLAAVVPIHLAAQQRDYTQYVNPFIGTGGHGHTFPGATVPFGMVQLSPDTRIDNWDGSSGYHYSDDVIYGFAHTHLSGTGIPDGCDILFMPTVGEPQFFAKEGDKSVNGYASKFSHANEKAEPGYYSVKLDDDGILAELSATSRVGIHRYTFPKSARAGIYLDLGWRDKWKDLRLDQPNGNRRIEGYRTSSSWAKNQTVYFVAEFSKPYEGYYSVKIPNSANKPHLFLFDPKDSRQILLKVAISFVSIEGARKNLEAELPHWDFDKVRADAKAAWNKELSKIEVSGGTDDQRTNFYTALYHTMIHPNVFNDADGKYKGHDGKVHQLRSADPPVRHAGSARTGTLARGTGDADKSARAPGEHYTVFSLWDTFRAAHPLYTIIDQKRTVDFINTFTRIYEQGGRLPVWELWGEETDTMIGYHAVSVIADAMAKGIKGFDYEKAYKAAKHSAELDHFGLAAYKKRGYISSEDENESVSKTLEYAYNDWCLMKMGSQLYNMRSLGSAKTSPNDPYLVALSDDIDRYRRRAGNFENLFDTETGFFRPRRNGGFIKPFAPQEVTFHFTEGNSWQYSFFVPHDVTRLMQLMGGEKKFEQKLDELFTTGTKLSGRFQPDITGLMGQYAHGNEPSHHIAYLYNYAGVPWKTQQRVRHILDEFYKPTPDGLIGNEDCGQMSAWYVLSAAGFYPVAPGEERYDLGTPLFTQVTFNLENGRTFIVRAPKVSPSNFYINSAKWNGEALSAPYITQNHIMDGGVLLLDMASAPNRRAFEYASTSTVYQESVRVPVIDGERTFRSSTTISMRSSIPRSEIRYTLDGTEPTPGSTLYSKPFEITRTTNVKAAAFLTGLQPSEVVEATFTKRENDWTVNVTSGYSSQYTGGGDDAIIDGLLGTTNFASGEWQGIQGKPYEAVIDLKRETNVSEIGARFLQHAGVWIWAPTLVEYEASADGVSFTKVGEFKPAILLDAMKPEAHSTLTKVMPTMARYIRIRAHNIGKIPAWHPGAGGDPWIFIDEVMVR